MNYYAYNMSWLLCFSSGIFTF
jgi:hypothetical protein